MEETFVIFKETASLDVDAQKGFTPLCPLELPVPGGDEIVEELNKNARKAKFRYMSKDAHPANGIWKANEENPQFSKVEGKNVDIVWNEHCTVGTNGFELLDGLPHPSEYNFIIYKGAERDMHPYSPVYHDLYKKISTGLIEKAKCDGVTTFIVGGLALNSEMIPLCVGHALIDLSKTGFTVILNLASTKGLGSEGGKNNFIRMLKDDYNIKIVNTSNEIFDLPF
jgi:nicotinamidase/pyrazinamidase